MKKFFIFLFFLNLCNFLFAQKFSYDSFESPKVCATCHIDITRQWEQAMMSLSYTHQWDEVEYFELALPQALKDEKVAEVKEGCNGCHTPMAYLVGDIPPKKPSENTRANEGVSCEVCHSIKGFKGDLPFNFNFDISPGKIKYGGRKGMVSPHHETRENPLLKEAEFCGICHNEKSPFGVWVKSTHLEWFESPQRKGGIKCQDCHMPPAEGKVASMGENLPDVRQHLFHGAHDEGKLKGSVEVRINPNVLEAEPGETVKFTAVIVNAKAGHKIPTGSSEERVLWLNVEAKDKKGKVYHIPVDKKGFPQEEYTISSDVMAYFDIGEIKDIKDFKGLKRDGDVPVGDRIFRLPYFDPKGRMTICQWNTASIGVDYRLEPLKAKIETYTFKIPENIPEGDVIVTARVYYSRLVSSVAKFLKIEEEEYKPILISEHQTKIKIIY